MEKKISFTVDSDIYEKFCLALNLTNESEDAAIETCMRWYIAKSFEKASQEYNPKITQATRDGGKDIIATKADPIPYTLIIECKHWGENHKVDVSVVRSVYGVQMAMQANQSVIVTSSRFTKDARAFAEERQNLMALWDIDDLLKLTMN